MSSQTSYSPFLSLREDNKYRRSALAEVEISTENRSFSRVNYHIRIPLSQGEMHSLAAVAQNNQPTNKKTECL